MRPASGKETGIHQTASCLPCKGRFGPDFRLAALAQASISRRVTPPGYAPHDLGISLLHPQARQLAERGGNRTERTVPPVLGGTDSRYRNHAHGDRGLGTGSQPPPNADQLALHHVCGPCQTQASLSEPLDVTLN